MEIEKEDERMYLQFLQNNIARMNTNSAQAKGWCIAIVAALLAIFAQTNNELFICICLIPVLASGDYNHYESGENRQNQSKRNSHYYNQTKVPKICADQ